MAERYVAIVGPEGAEIIEQPANPIQLGKKLEAGLEVDILVTNPKRIEEGAIFALVSWGSKLGEAGWVYISDLVLPEKTK